MNYRIVDKWITPNRWSRPQTRVNKIKAIVIHWVAVSNGRAQGVYNFFEGRKYGISGFGSAHETIDLNGDVWRMIPPNELAYHVGARNYKPDALDRISSYPNNASYGIECTHVDMSGKMTDATYDTLVNRCVDLCKQWGLSENDLWLHYEITGKDCHRWFVNNPNEWKKFKQLVGRQLRKPDSQSQYPEANVTFEGESVKSLLIEGSNHIQLRELADLLNVQIGYNSDTRQVTFNNVKVDPLIIEGRSYLPIREACKIVGLNVRWNSQTQTAEVYK